MSHQEETTCKHSLQWQRDILSNIIKFKCKRLTWLAVALSINTPHFYRWSVQKIMGHALILQTSLSHKIKISEKNSVYQTPKALSGARFLLEKLSVISHWLPMFCSLLWEGSTLISIRSIALRIKKIFDFARNFTLEFHKNCKWILSKQNRAVINSSLFKSMTWEIL